MAAAANHITLVLSIGGGGFVEVAGGDQINSLPSSSVDNCWSGSSNVINSGQINYWWEPVYPQHGCSNYNNVKSEEAMVSVDPDDLDNAAGQIILSEPITKKETWTREEKRLFLRGIKELGVKDWRGISQKYVKTRSPQQVRARIYYLRKRQPSIFNQPLIPAASSRHLPATLPPITALVSLGKFTAVPKPINTMIMTPSAAPPYNSSSSSNFSPNAVVLGSASQNSRFNIPRL